MIGDYAVKISWSGSVEFTGPYDNVTTDCMYAEWSLGSSDPQSLVAEAGRCRLVLDDSWSNQSGALSLYSPDNAGGALYGQLLPARLVQISCTYNSVTYILWTGYVQSITPHPDKFEVDIDCVDNIWLLSEADLILETQVDRRVDELLQSIILSVGQPRSAAGYWILGDSKLGLGTKLAPSADIGFELQTGIATIPYAGWIGDDTNCLQAIREICNMEWATGFCMGRDGKAYFYNRHHRFTGRYGTPDAVIDNSMQGITLRRSISTIANRVTVEFTPITATAGVKTAELVISDERVYVASSTDVNVPVVVDDAAEQTFGLDYINPVATTDVIIRSNATTAIITDQYTWSIIEEAADHVTIRFMQGGPLGYIDKLEVRGTKLQQFPAVGFTENDSVSQFDFLRQDLVHELGPNGDTAFAKGLAKILLAEHKDARTHVSSIQLVNQSATAYTHILARTLYDYINVKQSNSGIDEGLWLVGESHTVEAGRHKVTWTLRPDTLYDYWVLGESELGTETRLMA